MVLKTFWGSLGLLLGALGALLGVSWELLRASGSTKKGLESRLGILLGFFARVLLPKMALGTLWDVFGSFGASWGRL